MKPSPQTEQRLLQLWIVAIAGYFLWSRLDFSNHLYYFGDGTAIVEMIRLILSSHNWDPNWSRLAGAIPVQEELLPYVEMPRADGHLYHMSGYVIVAAGVCKIIYSLGLTGLSIQAILHGLNVVIQIFILFLLFGIGKKLSSRTVGLLAVTFFVLFPLAVLEAHYERPESWMCLLATATLYSGLHFRAAPLRQSILIGVLIGLAIATKVSLVFLGLIPAILLVHLWLDTTTGTLAQRSQHCFLYSAVILAAIVTAIAINTPFVLQYLPETIDATKGMARFYATPAYPYAQEHYNYFNELVISLRYFWLTLGTLWCLFVMIGLMQIGRRYFRQPLAEKGFYLTLVLPVVFVMFYFASQVNFIERNYSPLQGFICLIAALGVFYAWEWSKQVIAHQKLQLAIWTVIVTAMLYTPATLNSAIHHYLKHPDKPARNAFQDALKDDFPGFWIKNISVVYKDKHPAPEKPPKAPRIYQLDDLNDHWSRDAVLALETQGFKKVAIYCSEFSHLPTNSLIIYHAAAKNHYYVREDEWPADIRRDYLKTNCQ